MKKYLLLVLALTPFIAGCNKKPAAEGKADKDVVETEQVESVVAPEVVNADAEKATPNEPIPQDVQQFISLYKELLSFKDSKDFKRIGFGKGGKYYKWLEKANKLSKTADDSHFSKYDFFPGDLVSLAEVYASTQGKENEATMALRTIIDEGIAQIK